MTADSQKQKDRQGRGDDFQAEIRRSWSHVPNTWRMRIKDGGGSTRPADEVVLTETINVLGEHKRTASDEFLLSYLRTSQRQGLLHFEMALKRNYGLVFVSFLNEEVGRDQTVVFRFVTGCAFMKLYKRSYIKLEDFILQKVPCLILPLLSEPERTYNLNGVVECYKYL